MSLTEKIANALQDLISPISKEATNANKQAELTKEIPLDAELKLWTGEDLDVEDPQITAIQDEQIIEGSQNSDDSKTVQDELTDPGQNSDSIVGKGSGPVL